MSPGSSIANKSNTVVWHQGTPPSSPKRSVRRTKSASNSTNKSQSQTSPVSSLKTTRNSDSNQSRGNSKESNVKSPKVNLCRVSKTSTLSSKVNLMEQTIPEEKIHKKCSGSMKKVRQSCSKVSVLKENTLESSNIIVKITSPTSPPNKDISPDKYLPGNPKYPGENINSEHGNTTSTDAENNLKVRGRVGFRGKGIHRQSSLPDDGYLHPFDNIQQPYAGMEVGLHRKPPLARSSTLDNDENKYSREDAFPTTSKAKVDCPVPSLKAVTSPREIAKIATTASDCSFNSATLSYGTLFYSLKPPTKICRNEYIKDLNRNTPFPTDSSKSIHVVRLPVSNKNVVAGSIEHSIIKETNANSCRPSSSSILRARFASHNSRSLELEESNKPQEIATESRKHNSKSVNLKFNSGCSLNNAPSLPLLSTVSETENLVENSRRQKKERGEVNVYFRNNNERKRAIIIKNNKSSSSEPRVGSSTPELTRQSNLGLKTNKRSLGHEHGGDINLNIPDNSGSPFHRTSTSTKVHKASSPTRFQKSTERKRNLQALNPSSEPNYAPTTKTISDNTDDSVWKLEYKNTNTNNQKSNFRIDSKDTGFALKPFTSSSPNTQSKDVYTRDKHRKDEIPKYQNSLSTTTNSRTKCIRGSISNETTVQRKYVRDNSAFISSAVDSKRDYRSTNAERKLAHCGSSTASRSLQAVAKPSHSPPTSRPCKQSVHDASPPRSASSNVPSWMRQTISRILASTSPPYSRKSPTNSRHVKVNSKST